MTLVVASSCICLLKSHNQKFVKLFFQLIRARSYYLDFSIFFISITYIIKIDIEHHVAYVHKNELEDPFFRRLKLIVWLILVRSQILS